MIKPRLRPVIEFDPANKDHRAHYANFIINNGWHKSPVMFYVEPNYGNVLDMIRDKLSAHYLEQEFKFKRPRYIDGYNYNSQPQNVVKLPQKTAEKTSKKATKKP